MRTFAARFTVILLYTLVILNFDNLGALGVGFDPPPGCQVEEHPPPGLNSDAQHNAEPSHSGSHLRDENHNPPEIECTHPEDPHLRYRPQDSPTDRAVIHTDPVNFPYGLPTDPLHLAVIADILASVRALEQVQPPINRPTLHHHEIESHLRNENPNRPGYYHPEDLYLQTRRRREDVYRGVGQHPESSYRPQDSPTDRAVIRTEPVNFPYGLPTDPQHLEVIADIQAHVRAETVSPPTNRPTPHHQEDDLCPICYEMLSKSKTNVLPCHHCFHEQCILKWFTENDSCPMCRAV